MWHVSVASSIRPMVTLIGKAEKVIEGVGDRELGQWVEVVEDTPYAPGKRVVHIRRRLSDEEAALVGPVKDIRGTGDMEKRVRKVAGFLYCSEDAVYDMEPPLRKYKGVYAFKRHMLIPD